MTEPTQQPTDDEFMLALARRARAPQWEELAHGQLSLADAQRERAQAGDSADAIERASAYFRPFDADEQASLVDSLLAAREGADSQQKVPEAASAEVIPLRPRAAASSRWVFVATAIAIAAAVSLWWIWPRDPGSEAPRVAQVELPAYALETEGGLKQIRDSSSEPEGVLHYRRESRFEWVLRPDRAVESEVEVRGFAFRDPARPGSRLDLLNITEIGESGSIRIRGTIEDLRLESGDFVIALVVGRPGELPESVDGLAAIERDGWQVARIELVVED